MKRILVLGASGSIGKSTLDIIKKFPDHFSLAGFSVNKNIAFAETLKAEFPSAKVFIASQELNLSLNSDHKSQEKIYDKALEDFIRACEADIAVNGISGAAGLRASVICLDAKLDLALANKESIVMAGSLLKAKAKTSRVKIIPVDSEHAAIFSLINAFGKNALSKIILTASGGPFRKFTRSELSHVSLAEALNHPTWKMGGKISIDSATLANKALEVIEAVKLFDVPPEDIIVTVHPESIIHSMIQLRSGEIYAQASPPDMRFPILQALEFPTLPPAYLQPLDFSKKFSLNFEPPRMDDFPLLKMGFDVAKRGGNYPIAFNAANEIAVEKFLQGRLQFLDIEKIVKKVLENDWSGKAKSFDEVLQTDSQVRKLSEAVFSDEF